MGRGAIVAEKANPGGCRSGPVALAAAAAEGKEPSHLVEQVLWHVLTNLRASTS
jgi:hypothetical protein